MTFKADCLLGKQETNRFVWFSLIRLEIFLVVVLIQSVSSQISSTLIRNSLAGCTASGAVAGMLLPPGAPRLRQRGPRWLRPALARRAPRVARAAAGALGRGGGPLTERRSAAATVTAVPSSSVPTPVHWLRTWPIKHQTGCCGSAGGSPEAAPRCLLCNFYALLCSRTVPFLSTICPTTSDPCLLDAVPCPVHTAACEHSGNLSPA